MQLNLQTLSTTISTRFSDIAFAYLFGSSKNGVVKEDSDVDIAIYYSGNDAFKKIHVEEELEKALPGVIFDLVELKKADPVLAFEAIGGTLLFVRTDAIDTYVDFYTLTCRLYRDRTYWIKKQLEYRGYEVQWSD
jgi:predicted nucleotidyltransferase